MNKVKHFIKEHTLILIYLIVFLILLNGILIYSGSKYLYELSLFIFPLIAFYFGISSFIKSKKIDVLKFFEKGKRLIPKWFDVFLFGLCLVLIIGHLISVGGSPALKGLWIDNSMDIAELRTNITAESSALWGYLSSFNIKAILPFALLLSLYRKKKLFFFTLLIIGSFYAFSLMQKSYILTILLPIFIYLVLNKKVLQSLGIIATCVLVIFSLVYVANPQMRGGIDNITVPTIEEPIIEVNDSKSDQYLIRVMAGLYHRMFEVPGEMVVGWFEHIPKEKPFLYGSGYHFAKGLTRSEYRNYSIELYPILRPQYAERGLQGSVNTASFMYEYSNFGKIGMVLSAFLLALVLIFAEKVFYNNFILKISFNFFPIFMLSSGAITTALFSNGWGPVILLYFLFSNELKSSNE